MRRNLGHVRAAVSRFRDAPTARHIKPREIFTVRIEDASLRRLSAGIRALADALKGVPYASYVALERPHDCECVFYGPVRRVTMWSMSPGDGGEPRYVHRLDVAIA